MMKGFSADDLVLDTGFSRLAEVADFLEGSSLAFSSAQVVNGSITDRGIEPGFNSLITRECAAAVP